jgi:hypothetical protein
VWHNAGAGSNFRYVVGYARNDDTGHDEALM